MIPILYDENENNFTTNGLGGLPDCTKCTVTEEINGRYFLEFEYPLTGLHADLLFGRKQILAKIPDGSLQRFRISKVEKKMGGHMKITANHISYDLTRRLCWMEKRYRWSDYETPQTYWEHLTGTNPAEEAYRPYTVPTIEDFSFESDMYPDPPSVSTGINGRADPLRPEGRSVRDILMGNPDYSIVGIFGGEIEFDNKTIKHKVRRGADRNVKIRYGKNMTECTATIDYDTYNAVYPFYKRGDTIFYASSGVTDWRQMIVYHGSSFDDVYAIRPLDLTYHKYVQYAAYYGSLLSLARKWMNANQPWLPIQELYVSFAMPTDNTKELSKVLIGDTVSVEYPEMNISGKLRAMSYVWNVLLERYEDLMLSRKLTVLTSDLVNFKSEINRHVDVAMQQLGKLAKGTLPW